MEREEELSVICIKLVVKGKGKYQSTESGSVDGFFSPKTSAKFQCSHPQPGVPNTDGVG